MSKVYVNDTIMCAVKGKAVVANDGRFSMRWTREEGLVGKQIPVVMIVLEGVHRDKGLSYLDNRNGSAWSKVTQARGNARWQHREVAIEPNSFIRDYIQ